MSLEGRTALVTGSGRNIGRAIALEFAQRGANVVINARSNQEEAEAVAVEARSLGVKALVVIGDCGDKATIVRIRRESDAQLGHVDIYVSNAARRLYKDFFETTDEDWYQYLNQQLSASWYLAKAFAPGMRDRHWGRIIHINGEDGWRGGWTRVPHSTAKGGLRTLTKSLASGLGQFGITVNDVSPGLIETVRDPVTHPRMDSEFYGKAAERMPIRRLVQPQDVAFACGFLCSDRAAAITGAVLHVDGGSGMLG